MFKSLTISALVLAATQIASADTFLINRDNLNGGLCSSANPCGTIDVTGTDTLHVAISLNSPNLIFGNNAAFGFNVLGSTDGVTLSNFSSQLFTQGTSGNVDGWGNFEFRVDGPPGAQGVPALSFDVTRSGSPFTSPADIEAGATGGNGFTIFAMHLRDAQSGLSAYAGVTPTTPVPEPASLALMGAALVGVAALRKRTRRS